MTTAASTAPAPILNAFVDDTDPTQPAIALIRRVDGVRTVERVECTWDALWRRADLRDAQGRLTPAGKALLRSGAQIEASGQWVRGRWAREVGRKHMGNTLRASSHEADVDPIRRWFIDTGARVAQPRRAYFDLETDSRVPFNRKTEARILAWSIVSETGRSRSAVLEEDTDRAEAELLTGFWHLAHQFDQLLAWNGEGFDFPVIRARTARLAAMHVVDPSVDPADAVESPYAYLAGVDPREWLWLDHLLTFERLNTRSESGDEKTSLKLNHVAHALLGVGKHDFDASKTWQEWAGVGLSTADRRRARERLLDYCTQDTILLRMIEERTGYIRLLQTLAEACDVLPDSRGLNPMHQVDGFLLKLANERGHHFPTRPFAKTVDKFKGAYVMQPITAGITRDVHVCDFAALYPSIILSWNISPETKIAPNVSPTAASALSPTGMRFTTAVKGILPIALEELIRLRKEWNDRKANLPPGTPEWADAERRAQTYKVATNSFYGVIGSPYSRYFDRDLGEAITQAGVWLIKMTKVEAEKRGMLVVYADTDSCFVVSAPQADGTKSPSLTKEAFGEFVSWCNADLYPALLQEMGCPTNRVKLAYEKQYERIVFTSAKRYCGIYKHYKGKAATADSKPEITGLEYKRGDAALLARRLQSEVINLFVSGSEDPVLYRAIVERHKAHVLFDALPVEEVQLTKTLSKAIDEYVIKRKGKGADKGKTTIVPNPLAHVNIARQMRERGEEVGAGTRVGFVVRDGSKKIVPMHVSEFDGSNADRYYLWERLVYPPTLRLLAAMFPTEQWGQYHKVPRVNPAQLTLFP